MPTARPPWGGVQIITVFILAVLQLVSGQYSLQAPTSQVALSGSIRVTFTMPQSGLSYPPIVQLIDLSTDGIRKSKSVSAALSGGVTFECSYFDRAGAFQFRLQSTKNTSEILAWSEVLHVVWPEVEITVPNDVVASSGAFTVIAHIYSSLCHNMGKNRYIVDMVLEYQGKNETSGGQPVSGGGVVSDTQSVGTISDTMIVSFDCASADRVGLYTVALRSDFNQSIVARSQVFEVAQNADYGISVSTQGVQPNCSQTRPSPIVVSVTQPSCANAQDKVRFLGQTDHFSYSPESSNLEYISEQRIDIIGPNMEYFCGDFSNEYTGFCFRYVSVAKSGAVDEQASACIPYQYTGEPVNGQWGEWSEWGDCTATCGDGVRHRSRACTNPSPANGGAPCEGNLLMTEFCNLPPCSTESTWLFSTTPDPNCYCGCTMTSQIGNILANPAVCEDRTLFKWVISVEDNHYIRLEFLSFYLAIHREYLRVRDGDNGNSPLLAYHTGVALPGPVTSSGNAMYLEYSMTYGGNLERMGFNAVYKAYVSEETPAPPQSVGDDVEPATTDVSQLNNVAILIAGIVLGVVVVLLAIIFAVHARCSRGYDYKPGMPHDDTAETQLRGMATPSINSSSTHHSRPWGAAPIGRSTTTHSENSQQSTSKRGWPDGDRSQLYVMHNENRNYLPDASIASSHTTHRSTKESLPCIPSPYHEEELEKWTKRHGHKLSQQYLAGEVSRGSAGELSNSKHSGRTDRNTTHLAMKSPPQEFPMTGMHESRTSINSSKKRQETLHTTPLVHAVANVENTDNTSPYVNKDGQLTPLGMAVSKLNDNGLDFRVPEGAENPDQEKKEHRKKHRHKDRHDSVQSPDSGPVDKGRKGMANSEDAPKEVEKPKSPGRKLPMAPKMAFYSDDEPDFRPLPPKLPEEDIKAETLPRDKSREKTREKSRDKPREKSSHRNGPSTHRTNRHDRHHHRNGALSPQRTSGEEGLASGNSSTLRSDKSGSLDRHGHRDRSHRKPPVHPKHGSRPRKHTEKPAVPPRPDSHRRTNHVNHVDESPYHSFNHETASYSLPSDHRPSLSDYSGGMSVEPSPVRLPRPLNRRQNREMLTQVFISDESLSKPQSGADRSGAESSRSGASHRKLPQTPTSTGFSPPRSHKGQAKRVQSDLSLSLSQEEPEFDYYIPTVPGSYFENPFPMGLAGGPSERRINKGKAKSPSASLV